VVIGQNKADGHSAGSLLPLASEAGIAGGYLRPSRRIPATSVRKLRKKWGLSPSGTKPSLPGAINKTGGKSALLWKGT